MSVFSPTPPGRGASPAGMALGLARQARHLSPEVMLYPGGELRAALRLRAAPKAGAARSLAENGLACALEGMPAGMSVSTHFLQSWELGATGIPGLDTKVLAEPVLAFAFRPHDPAPGGLEAARDLDAAVAGVAAILENQDPVRIGQTKDAGGHTWSDLCEILVWADGAAMPVAALVHDGGRCQLLPPHARSATA